MEEERNREAQAPASVHVHDYARDPDRPRVSSPERATERLPELWDATELETLDSPRRSGSPSSISSGSIRVVRRFSTQSSAQSSSSRPPTGPLAPLKKFWRRNVILTVAQQQSRDHFALERTFLAYIRTSVAFAMLGVLTAQVFTLQRAIHHDPEFGFHKVGVPLACACYAAAVVVAIIGAFRFWRQQHAMADSKVYAGGWELNLIAVLAVVAVIAIFVLVILISATRD